MKTCINLVPLLFFMLILTGCGDSGNDEVTPETATFRVDLQQTGEHEKFTKIIVISGGDFKDSGTNQDMPTVLYDEELSQASLSFEAEGVRELGISTTIGFSPVADAPSSMALKIMISKNGKVIDQQTHLYTQDSDMVNIELTYKAKE